MSNNALIVYAMIFVLLTVAVTSVYWLEWVGIVN